MKIIIAGAGDVGTHLAKMLSTEDHDLIVIDNDEAHLKRVGSSYDVLTLDGSASSISLLKDANIHKADLFIAVTSSEEVNITASILAKTLGAKKTIARIDKIEYLQPKNREIFINLGIDYMFYPELLAAKEVIGLLHSTGTTDLVDFAGGKLTLLAVKLSETAPFLSKSIEDVIKEMESLEFRAVAITRNGKTIIPNSLDKFYVNDLVYLITNQAGIEDIMKYSGKKSFSVNNIMIVGGSRIGKNIALEMGEHHDVKLIEIERSKSYTLSNELHNSLVINADGRNRDMLMQEGLPKMDAFIAVSGNSETNILSCMLAKQVGVKKTIAEVENLDYINLAEEMGIDSIINKKLTTASRIFRFTMSKEVSSIKCLKGTDAEVMEFEVKPDAKVTLGKLKDIDFPKDCIIGGVIRGKSSFIATGSTEIRSYDRVVVFALPTAIGRIGKYFS
jgi:trk system potassium uptake protein